jgi:DTW domain-containing protein YfiP
MSSMDDELERLRAMIHRGWIAASGTTLRREDEKKARELVGLLREARRLLGRGRGRNRKADGPVVDAAAGKGYVGMALALEAVRAGSPLVVRFLERDARRASAITAAAELLGAPREGIDARAADLSDADAWPDAPRLVVSLHACGDATDRVIERAIAARAEAVLVAPCCVRSTLAASRRAERRAAALGLERHAEVRRRFVEAMVLGERALTLEAAGYDVACVPFAPPPVTAYSVAIRAARAPSPERMATGARDARRAHVAADDVAAVGLAGRSARVSRRENSAFRCRVCRMLGRLCVCPLMPDPPLVTRTRVVLVMHRVEVSKSTNTGRLAVACLANSEMAVRGQKAKPLESLTWSESARPLLLFPFEDATPIADVATAPDDRPVVLIVPDGTWRQASKVRRRVPGLEGVPCVSVPGEARLPHRLRAEAHAHGLSTIEAVARALGVLEGDEVRRTLEGVFRSMVERTLWTRGELAAADVHGGIPEGAVQHDPRGVFG